MCIWQYRLQWREFCPGLNVLSKFIIFDKDLGKELQLLFSCEM